MSFLPGFRGSPQAPVGLSFVSSSNANTTSISLPAGTATGDICVFFDSAVGNSTPSAVIPSGWTIISNIGVANNGAVIVSTICYKVLNSSDVSSGAVTGMNASGSRRKVIITLRASRNFNNIEIGGLSDQAAVGTPTTQTITTPISANSLCFFGMARGAAAVSDNGTLATSGTNVTTTSTAQVVVYEIQQPSFTSRTYGMSDTGEYNTLQSFYLLPTS